MESLHHRAKELFLQALSVAEADREAFVAEACGTDARLRQEVESLLAFHEEGDSAVPASGPQTVETRFAAGEVFAGRYRMIARLGRGGMGDVWQADDLALGTPVALKFIRSASDAARSATMNEVRLARKITHPAVCRVFDVGEADGGVFFSMELVRGEDLSSLIKHVGRLPSEKVIDIARQLGAGLAAAHAEGVLHRDLKPANVLIDDNGRVRITDFGIAITSVDPTLHVPVGTPGYMAPEQLLPGAALTERTDVYALGLVLYELVAGQHPFGRSGTRMNPPRPSTIVPDIDARLERVILEALSPDPRDRPASAHAVVMRLPPPAASAPPRRTRWWVAAATLAALVIIATIAAPFFLSKGARALTERDTIVLANFANTTGDPVFDGALKVALAVAVEQSPFLKVFPDERVRETLRLMSRSPDEPITRSIAREIAQREQVKALLAGSIAPLGRNYVLAVEVVNAITGDVMAREQAEAGGKEQVLTALGGLAARLREKLGESLASIQKFDAPLARATTSSLEALHAYSLALDEGRINPRLEAIPHLKRAIALDPDFALALALLSGVYANTSQTALAPDLSRRAFALRDRVSERERFFISWRYYRDSTQAWDKALELAQSWTSTYPREVFAFNSLGISFIDAGQYERAIAPLQQAIRLDPKFVTLYSNLGGAYMALDRYGEARAVLDEGAARQVDFSGSHRIAYLLAFIAGDQAAMSRELNASIGIGRTNAAFGWQAHALAFGGRVSAAHEQFRRGVQMAAQGGFTEVAAQLSIEDAEVHAIVGQCVEAYNEVSDGLGLSRDNFSLQRASRVLAWCGATREASALVSELERRYPEAMITTRVYLPVTAASGAIRRGEWSRALELVEPVKPFDRAPWSEFWPAYLRGQAEMGMKRGAEAAAEFQTILDHRGEAPVSQLYPLAYLGLARAAALDGKLAQARDSYDSFLKLWRDADPTLTPLSEARRERGRLR
jgi:serine/threonine protein kinase/tetratricopeptide (TPR) repeat protein